VSIVRSEALSSVFPRSNHCRERASRILRVETPRVRDLSPSDARGIVPRIIVAASSRVRRNPSTFSSSSRRRRIEAR
jgi:hypothetical protein